MTDQRKNGPPDLNDGMSPRVAQRLEYSIISLGVIALALIFQPFSLSLFAVGCSLVIFAGLINNLLPLCEPGVSIRALIQACLIVALVFCIVALLSITAAYLYGVVFVNALAPDLSDAFYRAPLVWGIAAAAALFLATLIYLMATTASDGSLRKEGFPPPEPVEERSQARSASHVRT